MKLKKINPDHYVVVDDSEIKEGDYYISCLSGRILQRTKTMDIVEVMDKKITHSTEPIEVIHTPGVTMTAPPMDFINIIELSLSEVKELIGEVDVEKKANEYARLWVENDIPYYAFIQGYSHALEDNKEKNYTEADMLKAVLRTIDACNEAQKDSYGELEIDEEKIIKSLQPKTEWEVEIVDGKLKLV